MSFSSSDMRQGIARFGEFEVDSLHQTLSLRGVRVKLQRQPFKVLELLIQRAPEIVSRDEIRRHVWGDEVYVDLAQNINFCIRQIRAALGDTSEGHLIETLPRQGYRFVAPLDAAAQDRGNSEDEPEEGPRQRNTKRQWLIAGLAALVAIGIVGVWNWVLTRKTVSGVTRISHLTTYPGDEREPSLSPDGRQVAFSWGGEKDENRDIYVVLVGKQHRIRLTSDPAEDAYPAWSPDGKQIAFIRRRGGARAEIILIPAIGGPERKLREIRLGAWISSRVLAWSADGRWLCFTTEFGTAGHHMLFLLETDSGIVKQILPDEDNGVGDSSAAFSPDGKWLAFVRFEHPANSSLFLQRLSSDMTPEGRPIVVKGAGVNPKGPVWTPDGKRIFFLDRSRIMEAAIGSTARPFYVSHSTFTELAIAGTSRQLVACLQHQQSEIWAIPLIANGMKAGAEPQPLVQSTAGEGTPRFSPNGRWLAFSSRRSGSWEAWLSHADGTNPRQLTHSSFHIVGLFRWSADARLVAFHGRLPKDPQVYVIGIEDGLLRQITRGKPGFMAPSWSKDGQTLYADALEDGSDQTYLIPVTGGEPRFVFNGSGSVEVPGRNLLIYEKQDQLGIYGRSLHGDLATNPEQLLVTDYQAPWGGFYPMIDGIYYVGCNSAGIPRMFRFYSFDTGKSVDVAPSPTNLGLGLTVTPDRTRLAYSTSSRGSEDLVQIDLQ
jgi:Tol biopolymer transport system component/DNA-binding winged helix-turn-helix (wHTH) protein